MKYVLTVLTAIAAASAWPETHRTTVPLSGAIDTNVIAFHPSAILPALVGMRHPGRGGTYFPGPGPTGWVPSDPAGANSWTEAAIVINDRISFYKKGTGQRFFDAPLYDFFQPIWAGHMLYEPRVIYDQLTARWIVSVNEYNSNGTSAVYLAISDNASLLGSWFKYRIPMDAPIGSGSYFVDAVMLGKCKDGIAFSAVARRNNSVVGNLVGCVRDAEAYAGLPLNLTTFTSPDPTADAIGLSANGRSPYLYGLEAKLGATNSVHWYRMEAFLTAPTQAQGDVAVPAWTPLSGPVRMAGPLPVALAPRPDVSAGEEGFVPRITLARTVQADATQKAGRVDVFAADQGNLSFDHHFLVNGTAAQDTYLVSATLNRRGDVGVTYNRSTSSTWPALMGEIRAYEGGGVWASPVTLASSTGENTYSRFGDYSTIGVDPVDNLSFWATGQVSTSTGQWQVRMEKFSPVYPAVATFAISPSGVVTGNSASGTVTLATPAPATGYSIPLFDDSAALITPPRVIIPAGQMTGTFTIGTTPSSVPITRHVWIQVGNVKTTRNLNLILPDIWKITADKTTVIAGENVIFEIHANGRVGHGFDVTCVSTVSELQVPPVVTIPYGYSSKTFVGQTHFVFGAVTRIITMSRNGRTRTKAVTILPNF